VKEFEKENSILFFSSVKCNEQRATYKGRGSHVEHYTLHRNRRLSLLWIVVSMILFLSYPAAAQMSHHEAIAAFMQANATYKKGDFAQAASLYEKIIAEGWESGEVYYNLATTHARLSDYGKAKLFFERAARLIPRDPDLAANRKFLDEQMNISSVSATVLDKAVVFTEFMTQGELIGVILALIILLMVNHLVSCYGNFDYQNAKGATALLLTAVMLGVLLAGVKFVSTSAKSIVLRKTDARFEPRETATVHYTVEEGEAVVWEVLDGEWVRVRRPDQKQGWVPKRDIEKI
jgi:Tetratricopeptide repeat